MSISRLQFEFVGKVTWMFMNDAERQLGICHASPCLPASWSSGSQQTGSTHDETSQSLAPVSQDMSFDVISNAGNTNQSPCPFLSL